MKHKLSPLLCALLMSNFITACAAPQPSDSGVVNEVCRALALKVIGLTEEKALLIAIQNNTPGRVVSRDGESFILTMGYQAERLNITVLKDEVVSARCG